VSVQDGQSVNAAITNAALMSRLNDTSTIGKVDILNSAESTLPTNGALNVSGGVGIEKSLNVALDANVDGNLSVDGTTTVASVSATTISTTGNITSAATVQGAAVTATGALSGSTLSTTGHADIGGVLNVTGDTNLSTVSSTGLADFNSLAVTTSATVGTTLGVTGHTSVSTLGSSGLATLNSLQVTNNADIDGNLIVDGNLTVNGTTTTIGTATLSVTDQNITVNNGGNDASAEGSGLTVDRTGTDGSLIYKAASATKWAAGALGAEVDLVDISTAQTLTNKSISGSTNTITNVSLTTGVTGTLPITNGGTGQTTQTAAFDALSPLTTKGDILTNDATNDVRLAVGTDGQILSANSATATGLEWIAAPTGGGGGAQNLISDGDAESGITNYIEGSYPAQRIPTGTFTASSGAGLFEISTSASAPLLGLNSFLLTKSSGASRRGRAIERTISLDPAYRGKVLQLDIKYTIVSGTFVAGDKTTDSSLIWYIAESNGGAFTFNEPSNFKMYSNSTTLNDVVTGAFQTKYDTTDLKLIAYVSEAANSAWVVKCEVGIKPNAVVFGTPMSDWISTTVTCNFTNQVTLAKKRRVGDSMEYAIQTKFSNTPSAVTGSWTLPDTIDTAKLAQGAISTVDSRGICNVFDASTQTTYVGAVSVATSTTVNIYTHATAAALNYLNPIPFTTNDYIEFIFTVPIAGLASVARASDGFDARLVDVKVSGTVASVAINNVINFPTTNIADGANYSAGTITILVSGRYDISAFIIANANTAFDVFVNGSSVETLMYTGSGTRGSGVTRRDLKAGDLVTLRPSTGASGTISGASRFGVYRVTGPQTITETEEISARYSATSGQTINTGANQLTFPTVDFDSHGINVAFNSIVIPVSGRYYFNFKSHIIAPTSGVSTNSTQIFVNGSAVNENTFVENYVATVKYLMWISDTLDLLAGDTVHAVFNNGFGVSTSVATGTHDNILHCFKV
jgi:hypothetical protein